MSLRNHTSWAVRCTAIAAAVLCAACADDNDSSAYGVGGSSGALEGGGDRGGDEALTTSISGTGGADSTASRGSEGDTGTASGGTSSVTTGETRGDTSDTSGTTGGAIDLDEGLLARFDFEDGWLSDGVSNGSVAGRGATCAVSSGACPYTTVGPDGSQAAVFGGGSHFTVNEDGSFDASATGFTIALWVRADNIAQAQAVFGKPVGDIHHNSWQFEISSTGGLGFTTSTLEVHDILPAHQLEAGVWVHVVGTFDGESKRVYVDGVLTNEKPVSVHFDMHDIFIGIDQNSGNLRLPFTGGLDDIRIYDRPLAAEEIVLLAGG